MYNNKKGWMTLRNPEKFIKPIDEHMQSFKNGKVEFKSSLEEKAFKYADLNNQVKRWSVEPFHITYLKPTDGKIHRYFIDMFLEFETGDKFIVEIKSSNETKPPKHPKKNTEKSVLNYKKSCMTYSVNLAKWNAAKEFAHKNGFKFIILTEKELG